MQKSLYIRIRLRAGGYAPLQDTYQTLPRWSFPVFAAL